MPVTLMPPTLMVLAVPTFLSAKLAVPARFSMSPVTLSEANVTMAAVLPS